MRAPWSTAGRWCWMHTKWWVWRACCPAATVHYGVCLCVSPHATITLLFCALTMLMLCAPRHLFIDHAPPMYHPSSPLCCPCAYAHADPGAAGAQPFPQAAAEARPWLCGRPGRSADPQHGRAIDAPLPLVSVHFQFPLLQTATRMPWLAPQPRASPLLMASNLGSRRTSHAELPIPFPTASRAPA